VPELSDLDARYVHEPWTARGCVPVGYRGPIVDHAAERQVALDRYERVRAAGA
jgi:deoxyribodipyrimidine photo-lyase